MNIIDQFIGFFSPAIAVKRELARATLEHLRTRRYEAAEYSRRTANWRATSSSPTTTAAQSLTTLRNRSRDLGRNNAYGKRAVQAIVNNTIGTGIRLTVESTSETATKKLRAAWKKWAESTACDYDGRLDLYGIQRLAMRTIVEGGECLIVKRTVKQAGQPPVQLQLLEGDYIDSSKHSNGDILANEYDFYGVRFDRNGKRLGYWLYEKHPDDFGNYSSTFYSVSDVIHGYELLRPGQARGVPFGVSAFVRLRDFDNYEDAQLLRQKIAACFSVFIRTPTTGLINSEVEKYERVEPAMIQYLNPGEEVSFGNPPPIEGYEAYTRQMLRGISAGYGVPYEALTWDLSNVNFSSGRMGWLEFHRNIVTWQADIMIPMLTAIWAWFSDGLLLSNNAPNPTNATTDWTTPKREMIDPVKETEGLISKIRAGLMSWQEAVRSLGYDPDSVAEELESDYKKFDKLGLKLECDLRALAIKKAANNAGT